MNPTWWRVTFTSRPDQTDAVAAFVVAWTGNGVEEPAPGMVCTTLESEPDARALVAQVTGHVTSVRSSITAVDRIDWSLHWRDGIVTRRFGRLLLTPSWLPVTAAPNEVVESIDPESAFGSGEHGSTRGALALLERNLRPGDRVLDLGSGSGILTIAAALLGARTALGIEVDEEALPIAEANAAKNSVAGFARFVVGDAAELAPLAGPADVICANILRSVNIAMLPAMGVALVAGGVGIFAGMELAEAELFRPVLVSYGWEPVDEVRDAGWWSVAARRQ